MYVYRWQCVGTNFNPSFWWRILQWNYLYLIQGSTLLVDYFLHSIHTLCLFAPKTYQAPRRERQDILPTLVPQLQLVAKNMDILLSKFFRNSTETKINILSLTWIPTKPSVRALFAFHKRPFDELVNSIMIQELHSVLAVFPFGSYKRWQDFPFYWHIKGSKKRRKGSYARVLPRTET